ncbi:hypothetical protein V7150_17735 [Neobacillus drentensis]|uniref:hypothetical protein n=1 Tax=Neobacillus drentensis TaxID=220684 RepID=UPI00300094D7
MDSIVSLFNHNNIKYIVSVDDCYTENVSSVTEVFLLNEILQNPHEYIDKLKKIRPDFNLMETMNFPENIREEIIQSKLFDLTDDEKKEIFNQNSLEDTVLTSQKENLIKFLKELHSSGAVKEYKTFGTINEAKKFLKEEIQNIWNPSEEQKVLWLIDREFGDRVNEGFDLLEYFCSDEYQWNIGILATQNTSDIVNEKQFNDFLEKISKGILGKNRNLIWLIDKDLIDSERSGEFVETIMHGLRRNYTFKITNFLTNTISTGIQEASTSFKNIEQSTINNIILKFSTREGASIIETLTRVLMAITKHDMNQKIYENFDNITKIIDSYDKLCEDIDTDSIANLDEVFYFRNKEKYNVFVNKHYYPVGFGDIFRINGQEYLLISQPCDIQIRGDNGNRNLQQATLLRITKKKPDHRAYSTLEYYHKTETYYVLYKESVLIDFNVLDLCSLNNNGKAFVKVAQLNEVLNNPYRYTVGQRKRMEEVLSHLKDTYKQHRHITNTFEQIQDYILSIESERKEEVKSMLEDYQNRSKQYWESLITVNNFNVIDDEIRFPVERICRLDELYTTNIMLEYSTYSSRLGLPGDYGLPFRHTEYKVLSQNPKDFFNGDYHLIDISYTITVLLSESEQEIYNKVISEVIIGNVSQEIENKIKNNPASFIKIRPSQKQIIIPCDFLIREGRENVSFSTKSISINKETFRKYTPSFSELILKLADNREFIKAYKLFNFYSGEKLNEIVNFKLDHFEDRCFSINIEDHIILEIHLNLEEKEDSTFKFSISLNESPENIKWITEKYLAKK